MAIEEPSYSVMATEGNFELRKYSSYIVAETYVEGDFEAVGSEGFRRLADYIGGKNQKKESISMTAPVSQEKKDNQWRITFLMPAGYSLEMLPEPLDKRVRLSEEPGRLMAAVRYSGSWSEEGYQENKALLEEFIKKRGLIKKGPAIWARYDPPFMPWFLRHNEVLIPIEQF